MTLISVIMPVYNTEKYVWEAIESILNQTFRDFELIIIDDGSTDTSWEIIQRYAREDERIKAFQNESNQKLVYTRNKALWYVNVKSKYIGICDADDLISSDRLAKTLLYLEKNDDISVVWIDLQYIDNQWNKWKKYIYVKHPEEKRKICFRQSPLSHGGALIRIRDRKKIGYYYDTNFLRAHDYELWSRFIWYWYKLAWLENTSTKTYHRITWWEQWKRKFLKLTIKNSLKIQRSMVMQYKMMPRVVDIVYILVECVLYLLPSIIVFYLFKKIRWAR